MKVNALKTIIKEAVKEAIIELKEEQLQESTSHSESRNGVRSSWEREFADAIRTSSAPSTKLNDEPLTLEQAIQHTKENLSPEDIRRFTNPGGSTINEDFSFTSANSKGFMPSQSHTTVTTSPSTSSLEHDIMKKSAAIVGHLKKTGNLTK